jgi:hypothetical protein
MRKLSKAQALAVKILSEIEAALIAGDWSKVLTAALQLVNLANNRDQREDKKSQSVLVPILVPITV